MKSNKLVSNNNSDNEDLMPTTASGLCTMLMKSMDGGLVKSMNSCPRDTS
jgi:hypothetical protein